MIQRAKAKMLKRRAELRETAKKAEAGKGWFGFYNFIKLRVLEPRGYHLTISDEIVLYKALCNIKAVVRRVRDRKKTRKEVHDEKVLGLSKRK